MSLKIKCFLANISLMLLFFGGNCSQLFGAAGGEISEFIPEGSIDVEGWLDQAEPLNDDNLFLHGYVPFKSHYDPTIRNIGREAMRKRAGHVIDVLACEDLVLEGFALTRGRGTQGQKFLAGVKRGESDAMSVSWTSPGNYFPLVFFALEDVGTTGDEAVSIYHNDELLGTYYMGDRNNLSYSFVYNARVTQEEGRIAAVDQLGRGRQVGVLLRGRRNLSQGDTLRITADYPGTYRISAFMLVPRLQTMKISAHEILHQEVKVWQEGRQPPGKDGTLQFAWMTRLPSKTTLIWSKSRQEADAGRGRIFHNPVYGENHQYFSDMELSRGETVYYRILAESNDGRRTATPVLEYTRPLLPAQTASGRIDIYPVESIGLEGTPAYGSVPLDRGLIYCLDRVRLLSRQGHINIPAQFREVGYHKDESIRWLGVNFIAEPEASYFIEYGPNVSPTALQEGIDISHGEGGFTVAAGSINAAFDISASAGLQSLVVPGFSFDSENMRLYMTGPGGERFLAGQPFSMELEHSGSEHVTVRTEGHFISEGQPLMRYIIRWQLYRDSPGIGIELTVGNDRDDERYAVFPPEGRRDNRYYHPDKPLSWYFVNIENLYLELDMPDDGNVATGIDGSMKSFNTGVMRLFQRDENTVLDESGADSAARFVEVPSGRHTVIEEETELSFTGRLDGRMLWGNEGLSAGARFDRFWQNYPKSYEFDGRTMKIGIMPSYSEEYYPLHRLDSETNVFAAWSDTSRNFFYLREGMYRFMYGKQKTHHITLFFGEESYERISESMVLPPSAFFMPLPEYNCSTFALGDLLRLKADTGQYPAINDWMRGFYDMYVAGRGYGMQNFGDVWGERGTNWMNLQADFAQSASREFWRTGSRDWLALMYEAALHFADIDTINYGPARGHQTTHPACHTGGEYLRQEGFSVAGYPHAMDAGHMRIAGIRNAAMITGSERLRENALQFAEFRASTITRMRATADNRQYNVGKGFKTYEMESNPFYLNAARISFDRMAIDLDPFVPEYSSVPLGYKEETGDERVDAIMAARIKYPCYTEHWDDNLKLQFRGITGGGRSMYSPPMGEGGEAYLVTGDSRYKEILKDSTEYGLLAPRKNWAPMAVHGVEFLGERASMINIPVYYLPYYLDAAGIKEIEAKELPEETKRIVEEWGLGNRLP